MKKLKKTEKKLSLNKLQMYKITRGLNSIRGGLGIDNPGFAGDNGANDTVVNKTLDTIDIQTGTN